MGDRAEVAEIRGYIDHLQDKEYVRGVIESFGASAILSSVATLVRSGEREAVHEALLFTEDAIIFGLGPPQFYGAYRESDLPEALGKLVYGPDYVVRHLAVHALNRLGPRKHARLLAAAVPWYLVHDPLNLNGLLVELSLRRPHMPWATYIEAMVTAPFYLTRWSAVELLWDRGAYTGWLQNLHKGGRVRQFLRRLAQDSHPRVRQEARWRLDQARVGLGSRRGVVRWRRRAVIERLSKGDPDPAFFNVWLNVGNYLSLSGEADYDGTLVEELIEHLCAHRISPGYDIEAHWKPMMIMIARGV